MTRTPELAAASTGGDRMTGGRRAGKRRRFVALGLCAALAAGPVLPAQAQDWRDGRKDAFQASKGRVELPVERLPPLVPGYRPARGTLEYDLWAATDRVEEKLRKSKLRLRDDALEDYVRTIVCRLAPAHCGDIRVYLVRRAGFNASMMPNGVMQVWTGLFLRCSNESQLALVLGHELAHYLQRHSVARWEAANRAMGIANLFALATMAFGVGLVGSLGQIATAGAVMGYTREQEREADRDGMMLLAKAGYDPRQGAGLWQGIADEARAANREDRGGGFMASHPDYEERLATARTLAEAAGSVASTEVPEDRYRDTVAPYWARWMERELRSGDAGGVGVLIERQIAGGQDDLRARYYRGEMLRRRGTPESLRRALDEFDGLADAEAAPVEVHRAAGLALWQLGRDAEAVTAFERYLQRAPDAEDRAMISSYIEDLR